MPPEIDATTLLVLNLLLMVHGNLSFLLSYDTHKVGGRICLINKQPPHSSFESRDMLFEPASTERLPAKDEQGLVLSTLATALGAMGPEAREALPVLEQAVKMSRLSASAREAIPRIEEKPVPRWW
jgi:hypothetical protein